MKNFLTLCALALLITGISTAAEIDHTTGLPAKDIQSGFVPLDAGSILWDNTHGVYLGYEPANYYSDLAGMLASAGNPITVTDQGVDNVDLSQYCALVIGIGGAYDSPYTSSEVAAITAFVADGGGLLVLSDNTITPSAAHLNPVTEPFGITVAVSDPPPAYMYFSDFAAHEIFSGINELYFLAAGEIEGVAPAEEVAWAPGQEGLIAVVDPHQVVVAGDINFCSNGVIGDLDNEAFIMNVFAWLCSGPVGAETRSWSDVKAQYR